MSKISGPLLDRIDLHIEVPAVKYKEMAGEATGEPSEKIRARVESARVVQRGLHQLAADAPAMMRRVHGDRPHPGDAVGQQHNNLVGTCPRP